MTSNIWHHDNFIHAYSFVVFVAFLHYCVCSISTLFFSMMLNNFKFTHSMMAQSRKFFFILPLIVILVVQDTWSKSALVKRTGTNLRSMWPNPTFRSQFVHPDTNLVSFRSFHNHMRKTGPPLFNPKASAANEEESDRVGLLWTEIGGTASVSSWKKQADWFCFLSQWCNACN